ncbi:MAG: hypothetical protein K2L73_02280 [Muribaculaceae bacterium]|nr:hypothetical protein [Muribaculaceae bacterium]
MADVINISLPKSWGELSQQQLRFLLSVMVAVNAANRNVSFRSREDYAAQTAAQVQTICLFKWSGMTVICPYGNGYLVKFADKEFELSAEIIASAITHLSWTAELPHEPVRLDVVDGSEAIPADISAGLSFDGWLACETLWLRYQLSPDDALLHQMAEILYNKAGIKLREDETLGVFYWWAGVKHLVSEMFPNFFKPSGDNSDDSTSVSYDDMRRNIDAQIRALTKGDVTKEREILSLNAIRALTELDAQAREYDDLQRRFPSNH